MNVKLTKPQQNLMAEIDRLGGMTVHEEYRPAQKLCTLGLASCTKAAYGRMHLELTEAGRSMLEARK